MHIAYTPEQETLRKELRRAGVALPSPSDLDNEEVKRHLRDVLVGAAISGEKVEVKKSVSQSGRRDLVIAIDAGHGGEDPGALGPGKVREKDVVLAIARRLRDDDRGDGQIVGRRFGSLGETGCRGEYAGALPRRQWHGCPGWRDPRDFLRGTASRQKGHPLRRRHARALHRALAGPDSCGGGLPGSRYVDGYASDLGPPCRGRRAERSNHRRA